ncbi:hypothetical protein U1Q18_006100 [Sarracenia purpurea var. burkii]
MSKMRFDRKPPLPRSPMRLRSRPVLRSSTNTVQTPAGSLTKTRLPIRPWDIEEPELRPEYRTISCELRVLAKMVQDEIGNTDSLDVGFGKQFSVSSASPLFERGRFYEEYSARRNERLKRKKGETGDERKPAYDLGVRVESSKRREAKRFEGLRNSIYSTPATTMTDGLRKSMYSATTDQRENPRYMLRSMCKEKKKIPLPVNSEKSVAGRDRKIVARRVVKR